MTRLNVEIQEHGPIQDMQERLTVRTIRRTRLQRPVAVTCAKPIAASIAAVFGVTIRPLMSKFSDKQIGEEVRDLQWMELVLDQQGRPVIGEDGRPQLRPVDADAKPSAPA